MRFQTGHLQNTCPQAKKNPKRKKRQAHKPKGWQVSDPLLSEEKEEENMGCDPDKDRCNRVTMQRQVALTH